ncbi:MAG: nucleotidyltransferase domain-containing protein [Actinomycetes bacterium]
MDLSHPLRVVTPTLDGDILRVLALADGELTPPAIHRLIGEHSVDGIRKSLDRLVSQGIVLQRRAGRASLCQLNRDHLAASAVIELAHMVDELLRRLGAELDGWVIHSAYAALFDSATRTDMRAASDIDLFVVRSAAVEPGDRHWVDQLDQLSATVLGWTGNHLNVLELGEQEVVEGTRRMDPVLTELVRDGTRVQGPANYLSGSLSRTSV